MVMYVLIGLSLSLVGVAGLQFFYLAYLERIDRERKSRIQELEHHCQHLVARLREAEQQIAEQAELIEAFYDEEEAEEIWADVIEEN
jgi:16S rRNA C1402 (ribose-2'-O) methylase RsmI